ncbi:ribosome-associated translation inhibitor RaiA [bacterium]|nr:ribosome-associated translation inhibitor RaiA [bacterium]
MRIGFTSRHFKASPRLRTYAEERVNSLKKFYDGIIECDIILDHEKLDQVAEIGLKVYGQRLVALEKTEDFFKSIDLCVEKLERQLKKYKAKLRDHSGEKTSVKIASTLDGDLL